MTSEECLGSGKNVSHNNCGSQRVNDVLIIRMKEQAIISVSRESDNCVDLKVLFHDCFEMLTIYYLKLVIFFIYLFIYLLSFLIVGF